VLGSFDKFDRLSTFKFLPRLVTFQTKRL